MQASQPTRNFKQSRLREPAICAGGLAEWSDSQQNSRIQSAIPAPGWKGVKREISQPGAMLDPALSSRVPWVILT